MNYRDIVFPKDACFLVTGGAGFIGSNLCEAILDMGFSVRCLDNLSTGNIRNIEPFLQHPHFIFIKGDIRELDVCLKACENADYVLHQAAWGSVPRSIEMPLEYCSNNITGTINMLEAARRCHVKKFVYASSSSVYGDAAELPKREGTEGKLLSPYAASKKACEEWAAQYALHYGLETCGLRYFNVFGRRQNPNGSYAAVIPRFICQLLRGERPVIHGDGSQTRDFTYIENVMDANLKACASSKEASGKVYNIAYGEQTSLNEVYAVLTEALGINISPIYSPPRPGDIKHSLADISRAQKYLAYSPAWSFSKGMKAAIEWYRNNLTP